MLGKNKKFTAMNIPVTLLEKLKAFKKANLALYEKSLSYEEIIEGLIEGVKETEPKLYKYYRMIYETEYHEDLDVTPVAAQEVVIAKNMTLHEAVRVVLERSGKPMSVAEITESIVVNGLYSRADGLPLPTAQVAARIKNYSSLFAVDRSVSPKMVTLKRYDK